MIQKFHARGNWKPGVNGQFVDIKALDAFVTFLPWALAIEAIVRGWELMRIRGLLLEDIPTILRPVAGEGAFNFEYFGFIIFVSGVGMALGLSLRRFWVIIGSSLLGMGSYFLLSISYFVEVFAGESGTGARTGFTFLIIAGLWGFKGMFAASKKSLAQIEQEAEKQNREIIGG